MTRGEDSDTPRRVLGIGSAVVIMVAAVLAFGPALVEREEEPRHPAAFPMAPASEPIAAEADVYRLRAEDLAVPPGGVPRRGAQRRRLATYRALRAFPGAPPRIPHALTGDEFLGGRCGSCHQRGGYVPRFGLYAPVTPHPELVDCLQCHVADGPLVGIGFPETPRAVCLQCHTLEDRTPTFALLDWPPPRWPETGQRAMEGSPPWIPHLLHLRGNCLACHGGPGAVEEIRTTHPERTDCRACHVPAPSGEGVFTRPVDGSAAPSGGGGA